MKTILTHDSSFHIDDVFAVAILLLKFPDSKVTRSRDTDLINNVDIVVDFGYEYDPKKMRFDHHQPGRAGKRENGIDYASAGLVWKEFGAELSGGEREARLMDRILIEPIDAHDNGIAIAEYQFDKVREFTIGDFIYSYITPEDNSPERLYKIFMEVVEIAKDLLLREIKISKLRIIGEDAVRKIYEQTEEKWLIELPLPEENFPWREVLSEYPEPVFVLYPRRDGKWGIKAVSDPDKPFGTNRESLPIEWGGLTAEKLQNITGVKDAVFSHTGRFMAAAITREGAISLAKLAHNA